MSAESCGLDPLEAEAQVAYVRLAAARVAAGVSRLAIGLHLVKLREIDGWRGRSGALSFRRFLLEEGLEPTATYQYMTVASAFLIDHGVAAERIATVSMRLLVLASRYLVGPSQSGPGNIEDVIAIITTLPAAEATVALQEQFDETQESVAAREQPRASRQVATILNSMDHLTFDMRAELYRALRVAHEGDQASADRLRRIGAADHVESADCMQRSSPPDRTWSRRAVIRRPVVFSPDPPFPGDAGASQ